MSTKTPRAKLLAALNQHALASAAFDACLDFSNTHYPALLQAKLALQDLGALNAQGDIEVRLTPKQHDLLTHCFY